MGVPKPPEGTSYSEYLLRLYQANKAIIDELAYWRKLFGITHRGLDRSLAYLFEKIRTKHPYRWKKHIRDLMRRVIDSDVPLSTLVGKRVYENYSEELEKALRKDGSEIMQRQKALADKLQAEFSKAAEKNAKRDVQGVPDEFLPEWYFVSGEEFSLYHQDWIAPFLQKAEQKEFTLLQSEEAKLEGLKNAQFYTTQEFFNDNLKPLINSIASSLNKKSNLFALENVKNIESLSTTKREVEMVIAEQQARLNQFLRILTDSPDKFPHQKNLSELLNIIAQYRELLRKQSRNL